MEDKLSKGGNYKRLKKESKPEYGNSGPENKVHPLSKFLDPPLPFLFIITTTTPITTTSTTTTTTGELGTSLPGHGPVVTMLLHQPGPQLKLPSSRNKSIYVISV